MIITNKPLPEFNKRWTLFLDRDGVLNHEKDQDYIHDWSEFIFYPGTKEALSICSGIFNRIIVVTNQRGVGKGVTKLEALQEIHLNMQLEISSSGGRIDKVYFCPDLSSDSFNRKPHPGMAYQAKLDYPEIDFTLSVMIGNNLSDMQFGRHIGSYTVFLKTTHPDQENNSDYIDMMADSLIKFSQGLVK